MVATEERTEITIDAAQKVTLSNRDMIDFRAKAGRPFLEWMVEFERAADDDMQAALASVDWTAVTALAWIVGRRHDPSFTWDEALDAEIDGETMRGLFGMIADPTVPATPS